MFGLLVRMDVKELNSVWHAKVVFYLCNTISSTLYFRFVIFQKIPSS